MIPLTDPRWKDFDGGYRVKYDASVPLTRLESRRGRLRSIWSELWENLYHQGDVGVASYAAIPHVVRIVRARGVFNYEPFALAVAVELARGRGQNPEPPEWLAHDYSQSLRELAEYGCANLEREWDYSTLKSLLALIAVVKGGRDLGELILDIEEGSEKEMLKKFYEG
jgi:hypothetical protein